MPQLPTGTVTFLFTDIEGSTRLLEELGSDKYDRVQDEHAAIMRRAIEAGEGVEVRTEGDSFFFRRVPHAGRRPPRRRGRPTGPGHPSLA